VTRTTHDKLGKEASNDTEKLVTAAAVGENVTGEIVKGESVVVVGESEGEVVSVIVGDVDGDFVFGDDVGID